MSGYWAADRALLLPAVFGAADLLSPGELQSAGRHLSLDAGLCAHNEPLARAAVRRDEADAAQLHVPGTPTFLPCCPGGRVIEFSGYQGLLNYLAAHVPATSPRAVTLP